MTEHLLKLFGSLSHAAANQQTGSSLINYSRKKKKLKGLFSDVSIDIMSGCHCES